MPELPDISLYIEALQKRIAGVSLEAAHVYSPFLLRTAVPPIGALVGKKVLHLVRLGKRICIGFENDLWVVIHLMVSGRLHWVPSAQPQPHVPAATLRKGPGNRKDLLARFEFSTGSLLMTEAASKKRASIHVLQGAETLASQDPGGLEVLGCSLDAFSRVLTSQNHTLKRALTDPRLFSGIGNAYSDEILHRARLSPVSLTQKLAPEEIARLHQAIEEVLIVWTTRLRVQAADQFPEHVTAFRPEMAVHGKFGKPCPVCGTKVQRIRYEENETNYCPSCQTQGKLLADRSLSLLLKKDWPRTLDELEELKSIRKQ